MGAKEDEGPPRSRRRSSASEEEEEDDDVAPVATADDTVEVPTGKNLYLTMNAKIAGRGLKLS